MNTLFAKKLFVAFLVGFGGVLIPAVLDLLDKVSKGVPNAFGKEFLLSLIAGAFAAGLRALFALLPLNLVPSDSQHTLGVFK